MLQVTDTGATITLTGRGTATGDGLFWFASALLIGAIGVAMAMSLLPMRWAIGALALLVVASFIFNQQRQKIKTSNQGRINSGQLEVAEGYFIHQSAAGHQRITLQATDKISVIDSTLIIKEANGQQKCSVTGFESAKEAQIMQAVLQGQKFGRRNANIKMQSS